MSVIVIVSDFPAGDREFARSLADRLGYSCVEPEVVIERAAARGISQHDLREALQKAPGIWRSIVHTPAVLLTILRAALAEEIRWGNSVCYGNLGLLLPRMEGLLWIRVEQSRETRCARVRERLKWAPAEAAAWVRERDRDARRWRRWVCGPESNAGPRGDFSVDLESVGVERACAAIALKVSARADDAGGGKPHAALEDLSLSCRVRAALALDPATTRLELEVRAEKGLVFVQGKLQNEDQLDDVIRVLLAEEGVADLNLDGVSVAGEELLLSHALKSRTRIGSAKSSSAMRPRIAWAATAAAMVLLIAYAAAVSRVGRRVSNVFLRPAIGATETFTGIITDTKCTGNHAAISEPASAECVRRCVRTEPGAKFALHDGKALYILTDQAGGDKFAGRRVTVTGSVDKRTRMLTAKSIRLL